MAKRKLKVVGVAMAKRKRKKQRRPKRGMAPFQAKVFPGPRPPTLAQFQKTMAMMQEADRVNEQFRIAKRMIYGMRTYSLSDEGLKIPEFGIVDMRVFIKTLVGGDDFWEWFEKINEKQRYDALRRFDRFNQMTWSKDVPTIRFHGLGELWCRVLVKTWRKKE